MLECQEAEEGETAFLCCELSKPGAAVNWKKGSVLLKPGRKYEIKQNGGELQLQIHELTSQDSGVYTCCVGSLLTSASLDVKGIYLLNVDELLEYTLINIIYLFSASRTTSVFLRGAPKTRNRRR